MALENMASDLVGWVPKISKDLAYTLVNDAWMDVRNDRLWSFQLGEDGINSPNVISNGTVTVTLGINTVTLDATGSASVTGLFNPLLTQRQFRVQGFSIYSVISANFAIPSAVVLTLDRTYVDPTGTGLPFQIYQAYYPAPVADFKRYIDWRDMVNGFWLDVHSTRREVNMGDPQRLYYDFPYWVLSDGLDQRGAGTSTPSATLGFPWHELYPNPLSAISYMRWWVRTGADLVNPSDTLPYPITEKLVKARSRMLAYQWAEGNRDATIPRGQTADYKFLYAAAEAEYKTELRLIGLKDRDIVDLFLSRIISQDNTGRRLPYYSTLLNRAYSGS
jgi:hypothetical protein